MARTAEPRARVLTPRRLRPAFLAGVGLLGVGQATAIGGILVPPLFVPGTVVLGLGLIVLAVAGGAASLAADGGPPEPSPPQKRA